MPEISVIIPVYKAEASLEELHRRLRGALEPLAVDFELILVEDCGGDRSWDIICELASRDPRVVGIQFTRNFGQHYGITAGLDACRGRWAIVMDCDLQDRPEEIPRLYAKAQEGFDVVLTCRKHRKHPPLKRLTAWMFYKVFNYLSGMDYDGQIGNYRIVSRRVVEDFRQMRENLRFFSSLMSWMGYPAATIEVEHAERHSGKSTYTMAKLFKLAGETVIAYSDKPLWISVNLGFLFALLAFLYGIAMIVHALVYGATVVGWSSLIVSLYFLGGIIIANLGIIGIYLGKTFNETKKRPLYIVRATRNLEGVERRNPHDSVLA